MRFGVIRRSALGLVLTTTAVVATGCGGSPPTGAVTLVDDNEPGPRLTIDGVVRDAVTGDPLPAARVVIYQTDHAGTYQPTDPSDESTARLGGETSTLADGTFRFLTVQPGEYPGQPIGNRHIHFHSVSATGYETAGFVLLFDDNVRADVREWAEDTGFGVVIPLEGSSSSGFGGFVDIALEPRR